MLDRLQKNSNPILITLDSPDPSLKIDLESFSSMSLSDKIHIEEPINTITNKIIDTDKNILDTPDNEIDVITLNELSKNVNELSKNDLTKNENELIKNVNVNVNELVSDKKVPEIFKKIEPTAFERIRYSIINNLINLLSRSNFNQMFMSCYSTPYQFNRIISSDNVCIVGNAPNLLGKGKGALINKYQLVIRFTDFKITGFENDVGTKTNIWITGGAKQTQIKKRSLSPNTIQLYLSPNQYTVATMSQFITKNLQMNPKGFIFYKDITFMRMIMKTFGIYPSTGLATIFILIAKFGKVDTIGFNFYQNGIHYYNNKYVINSEHNWKKEYEIYNDLIKLGYVRNLLNTD